MAAISPPFDVLSTGVRLKHAYFGLLDSFICPNLRNPFVAQRYAVQKSPEFTELHETIKKSYMPKATSTFDFDNKVRGRFLGYKSGHVLYRRSSCDVFIPGISIPFLVLASCDDPIAVHSDMPRDDLLRNENCTLIEAANGGHCDFFT